MATIWGNVTQVVPSPGNPGIVVSTRAGLHGELRIRALVEATTFIARGVQRIPLTDIHEGEFIELTYLNKPQGLIAESIYVRADPHGS
ncbi:hypothetical protein [Candidatus Nitrospira bockiana]